MSLLSAAPGYGYELLKTFVPPGARGRYGPDAPLISGAVLAEVAPSVGGPILEFTWPGVALAGAIFRATRHLDCAQVVAIPASRAWTRTPHEASDAVVDVAVSTSFDRPLALLARAKPLTAIDDGDITRLADGLDRLIGAGFTAIAFAPGGIVTGGAEQLLAAAGPALEHCLGVEVEFPDHDGSLLLAQLDELGVPLSGVRGADPMDELCGGLVVVDPLCDPLTSEVPMRVVMDGFVLRGLTRALPAAEAEHLVGLCQSDPLGIAAVGAVVDEMDASTRARIEAIVYATVLAGARHLGAEGTGGEVLDALAAAYLGAES